MQAKLLVEQMTVFVVVFAASPKIAAGFMASQCKTCLNEGVPVMFFLMSCCMTCLCLGLLVINLAAPNIHRELASKTPTEALITACVLARHFDVNAIILSGVGFPELPDVISAAMSGKDSEAHGMAVQVCI